MRFLLTILLTTVLLVACGPRRPTAGEEFAQGAPMGTPTPEGRLDGEALAADTSEHRIFLTRIVFAIRDQFTLPRTVKSAELSRLSVVIDLKIDADGQITEAIIAQPSGNKAFDQAALRAVNRVTELPPPPATLATPLEQHGMLVRFRADDAQPTPAPRPTPEPESDSDSEPESE